MATLLAVHVLRSSSSRILSIPLPFGAASDLKGQLTDLGTTTDNRSIVDMTFDNSEISESFGVNALTFVLTPSVPASFSSGAPLSAALTAGRKLYGYKYTSSNAAQETAMQALRNAPGNSTVYDYADLFPGTFFASPEALADQTFVDGFALKGITFAPLSALTLEADARYLIIAEEAGITLTVRNLVWCGNSKAESGENCGNCPADNPCQDGLVCETGSCVNAFPPTIAQCSDGIDNDHDGVTDGAGIRILGTIGTFKETDTFGSLINGSFVRSETGNIPWVTMMPMLDGASVSPKYQLFTPGSFQNEQIYDSDNQLKAVKTFNALKTTVQADLCDPADIEEFHLVGVRSPLHGTLHLRVATGKCTGIVVFSQGDLNSAYGRKEILVETLTGSRIARVAVFNNTGRFLPSVYGGIPQDRILSITSALEDVCYSQWVGYLCYSASVFSHPNYSLLADSVRAFFGVPATLAPAGTYDCNFDSRCGSGTCYPDPENGTGIRGVVIGSNDPALRPEYWNVIPPEHWMKISEIVMDDGTIFASFGSWPIIKTNARMQGPECTGTEQITRVPVAHFIRIRTGAEPLVREISLPDNIQYLSDLVWDKSRKVLYGIAATGQQPITNAPGEYRLVTIDPDTLSVTRSVTLPQLGGFLDFKQHLIGTSLDGDWYNWMPITVSDGPMGAGNLSKTYHQLFLDTEDNTLVVAGFARRGIHTQPGAVPEDRPILRIDLSSMAVTTQKIAGLGYNSLADLSYVPETDTLTVSAREFLVTIDTRTGSVRPAERFGLLLSNGNLLLEGDTRWSVLDAGDFHEIFGFEKAAGYISYHGGETAFQSEPDPSGMRTLYSLNFLTGERTAIMGPAADVPIVIKKDAVADAYYIYGNRRQIVAPPWGMPWFNDWKRILPCNP
jgi:hypothetical protein